MILIETDIQCIIDEINQIKNTLEASSEVCSLLKNILQKIKQLKAKNIIQTIKWREWNVCRISKNIL